MQRLDQRSIPGATAYTAAQITAALLGPGREQWHFDLLDFNRRPKANLDLSVSYDRSAPVITHDSGQLVKRHLKMLVRGNAVPGLNDLVRVRYRRTMPVGDEVEWRLGVFTTSNPEREITSSQSWVSWEGTDLSQLLVDGKFIQAYAVAGGVNYVAAIRSIVAQAGLQATIPIRVPDGGQVLPMPLGWDAGTSYLKAINDLLQAIAYLDAWFDEDGALNSSPLPDYTTSVPSFVFDTTVKKGNVTGNLRERRELSKAYNQILVKGEDNRRAIITAFYQVNRPDNPISVPNWHPKLYEHKDSKLATPAAALAKARSLAQEFARVYGEIEINTLAFPVSQNLDVYRLIYSTADEGTVSANYVELKWQMHCQAGGATIHTLQRIVPV